MRKRRKKRPEAERIANGTATRAELVSVCNLKAADQPAEFKICGSSEGFELLAEEGGEGKGKLRKFAMTAYTGGTMDVGFGWPVVVDLEGMRVPSATRPIFKSHDPTLIVGHTDKVEISQQRLKVSGVISGVGEAAQEVVALAANGFPWQASIGARVERREFVDRGEKVKVNGRSFDGPIIVVRASTLGEVSFVPIGADMNTSADVAAQQSKGKPSMFEQWLTAKGFDPATLTESSKTFLRAQFDAEQKTPPPTPTPPVDVQAEQRRVEAAETARTNGIKRLVTQHGPLTMEVESGGQKVAVDIAAHAIGEGWTVPQAQQQFELEKLRAERPKNVNGFARSQPEQTPQVLEAALCLATGLPNVEKQYKPEVMEAAYGKRRMGLHELLMTAAAQNGRACSPGERVHDGNLREVLKAAFSTVTLPGILGNVANKNLLAGYTEEDDTWREVSTVKSANNFYQRTYYRMLDNMEYEEVGAAGEIKHGTVDQESYTADLKTYAKMFALTRRDIINDDLGAFADIRTRLGRGAKKKFNNLFWTNFLASHSTFFTTARGNYITGATTTLLTDGVGLGLGLKAFRQMKTPNSAGSDDGGKRINARPSILLVPPELEYAADQLFMGEKLNVGSGAGEANIYRNKYRPVVNAWLSDTNFTGYSTTAWYLMRSDLPMMVVSFLGGNETPTVESADADFNTLGVQFRGYHDFYANQAEYLCGVKSKGAA